MFVLFPWFQDKEDPFYMVDVGRLLLLHERWEESLPSVHPFYAVKCNNDPVLLQTLALLGCGFDCASKVRGWLAVRFVSKVKGVARYVCDYVRRGYCNRSVGRSVGWSVCRSVGLSACLSVGLLVCWSVCWSVGLSGLMG